MHPSPSRRPVTVILPDPRLPDLTKVDQVFSREELEQIERAKAALRNLEGYEFEFWDDHESLIQRLTVDPPEFVLNLCDTGFRNFAPHELHVPALLELFQVPYTGNPPVCLGLCYDKSIVHAVAADCGIPVPNQRYLAPDANVEDVEISYPALVKPKRADGGVGITARSVVADPGELRATVRRLRAELPGHGLLVQTYLTGAEYGVGLIGNPGQGITALPLLEVDWSGLPAGLPRILGYESKTMPDSPYWTELAFRPTGAESSVQAGMIRAAETLFERVGCQDYARFDFRAGADGVVYLLEINPNPAWCWDGKFNLMASVAGMSYPDLFGAILAAAESRVAAQT